MTAGVTVTETQIVMITARRGRTVRRAPRPISHKAPRSRAVKTTARSLAGAEVPRGEASHPGSRTQKQPALRADPGPADLLANSGDS